MIEAEGNMSLKAVVGQRELNILPYYFYSLAIHEICFLFYFMKV